MFQITSVMTRSLSFSWQIPETLNGVLVGYQLSCQPLLPGIPSSQFLTPGPTAVVETVSGLYPGVRYNCSIVVRNFDGPSDPVYINGTTLETGMYMYNMGFMYSWSNIKQVLFSVAKLLAYIYKQSQFRSLFWVVSMTSVHLRGVTERC